MEYLKGAVAAYFETLYQNFSGGTEENENCRTVLYSGRRFSNCGSPDYDYITTLCNYVYDTIGQSFWVCVEQRNFCLFTFSEAATPLP
jgi:hypothetical protein